MFVKRNDNLSALSVEFIFQNFELHDECPLCGIAQTRVINKRNFCFESFSYPRNPGVLMSIKKTGLQGNALAPPFINPSDILNSLRLYGYGVIKPSDTAALLACTVSTLDGLTADWDNLPADNYLKDGGRYRQRRHSSFVVDQANVTQVPHRAHYQPLSYNALHGGMLRMFEPMNPNTVAQPVWSELLCAIARVCSAIRGEQPWYVEAHQFRIDTRDGIGRPTPEGAHRDGVDFVVIVLVSRVDVSGGESRIFEADGPHGQRFTLSEPWTLLILDDQRVIHESTPIQPTAVGGHRDTLVLTFRSAGFLDPMRDE